MDVFLILLLMITCAVMFLFFQNKFYSLRKQILFLSKQNNTMRHKTNKNIIIKYSSLNFKYGLTRGNCSLNLAPIDESLIVCTLQRNTTIDIINRADVNGQIWYEVSVFSRERINNQGWIKATQILFPEIATQISTF
ncbi:MAG: hypothetical protein H7Y18_10540 [Clostridiaceae bacterium]|nr:hypothetical protein [Clostridiaceae bacterium]